MKIAEFFQEGNGALSATRLAFLCWAVGMFAVWAYLSITNNRMAPIEPSSVTILAILMTGKVAQKFSEEKANDQVPEGPKPS